MRVLTYNVHGCVGSDGETRPERVLDVIREVDADLIALQEVHDEDDADRSFLRALRDLPYDELVYGPTMRKPAGDYGNVLLSRGPVMSGERIDLSISGYEPRGAIVVRLDGGPSGDVEVVATHLGLRARERREQVARLIVSIDSLGAGTRPALRVVLGDFNEWWPWSASVRALARAFGASSSRPTFPSRLPLIALDRVFVSPRAAVRSVDTVRSARARLASDHLPLVAELTT